MKKYNIRGANGLFYRKMIVLNNMNDYTKYYESDFKPEYDDSQRDIINKIRQYGLGHCAHTMADIAETISNVSGEGSLIVLNDIANSKNNAILKIISEGGRVAINSRGGYFDLCDDDIVENIIDDYIESDINVFNWNGGNHFYAKIAGIDVVDTFGQVKWNNYDRAMDVAKKYLIKLNDELNR